MNNIDRLIAKALEKTKGASLFRNNPYLGKPFSDLLAMMSARGGYSVPENGTFEKDQYHVALLAAYREKKRLYDMARKEEEARRISEAVPEPEKQENKKNPADDPMAAYKALYGGGKNGS